MPKNFDDFFSDRLILPTLEVAVHGSENRVRVAEPRAAPPAANRSLAVTSCSRSSVQTARQLYAPSERGPPERPSPVEGCSSGGGRFDLRCVSTRMVKL